MSRDGSEPRDLGALEKAVNDAAGRASNLWISFVFFATLIAITTGTVTHKHLFLELPLKLPVLNVELPLMGYFFAVPLFFVVFHFYMLLQLDGLGAKIEDYNAVLREQHPLAADRRLLRQRLDSFIFAQVLVGARDRREGQIGRLNRAVAWITMVGLPIGTLLLLQLMFLPYHHQGMTWWHRLCVLADLGLVWFFWGRLAGAEDAAPTPATEKGEPRTRVGALRTIRVPPALARVAAWLRTGTRWAIARRAVAAGTGVVIFTTVVVVYPTEWIHAAWFRVPVQPLTRLLLEGELGAWPFAARRPWLGSSRLQLADTDLGVEERLVALAKSRETLVPGAKDKAPDQASSEPRNVTLSLRDRDLSYAILVRVDLRQADLTRVEMRGANLFLAQLHDAHLSRAQLQGVLFTSAQLQAADLRQAELQGANLSDVQLQGAKFSQAQLQAADLSGAQLQAAQLFNAKLPGANLFGAQLQGADLSQAELQGADLSRAELQGANLKGAQLQGASLSRAQLQGANLEGAQLQGANLKGAQLQGADLSRAQLQGADLREAELRGANLTLANVYRTGCPLPHDATSKRCLHASARIADARRLDLSKSLRPKTEDTQADAAAAFRKFVDDVLSEVPATAKPLVKERLSALEPGARTPEQDAVLADRWRRERARSLLPARRAHIVADLACGADGAPHVARGLLGNGRLRDTGHHLHDIAAKMRGGKTDASKCAGVRGFLDADWQTLDELVKKAPPKQVAKQPRARK